jgi:hypothetical protein
MYNPELVLPYLPKAYVTCNNTIRGLYFLITLRLPCRYLSFDLNLSHIECFRPLPSLPSSTVWKCTTYNRAGF